MKKGETSFEENVGIKWSARIGIIALVLGIGYFVKYAIDQGWINEIGRIVLGLVLGLALIIVGELFSKNEKYTIISRTLVGGGLAVCYFIVYAAYNFEAYRNALGITLPVDVALLILVVLVAIILSLKDNSMIVAGEAFFLGFLTSFLGNDLGIFTLLYTSILAIGLIFISVYKHWVVMGVAGTIATYLTYSAWYSGNSSNFSLALLFLLIYFIAYSIQSLFLKSDEKGETINEGILSSLVNAGLFTYLGFMLISSNYPQFKGLFLVSLAVFYFILYIVTLLKEDEKLTTTNLYLALFFLTLTVPVQLNGHWITISWALEALLLTILGVTLNIKNLRTASFFVGVFVILKTLFVDSSLHAFDSTNILNSIRPLVFIVTVIVLYLMAWLIKTSKNREEDYMARIYIWAGTIFACLIVSLEFFHHHQFITIIWAAILLIITIISLFNESDDLGLISYLIALAIMMKVLFVDSWALNAFDSTNILNSTRPFAFLVVILCFYLNAILIRVYKDSHSLESVVNEIYTWAAALLSFILILLEFNDFWVSIGWAFFAFLILILGFILEAKAMRLQAIIIFGITLLKVFLYDTWGLPTPYKVASYMILGVILLSVSFIYSKYKDAIKKAL